MARAVLSKQSLSGQEERMARGDTGEALTTEEAQIKRPRLNRLVQGFRSKAPKITIERARILTQVMKETEGEPLILRWAKFLDRVAKEHPVYIADDELIVGRIGPPPGRYSVLYPEIKESKLGGLKVGQGGEFSITEEDQRLVHEEIVPYWQGKTLFEAYVKAIPEDLRHIQFENDGHTFKKVSVMSYSGSQAGHGVLIHDNKKVLERGFNDIKREAQEKLAAIDIFDPAHNYDKMHFYQAVIITCDAIATYAKRHADLARDMAAKEKNPQRKKELLQIAETCDWVPANPARTFREALQSVWFATVFTDFEVSILNHASPGRIDQYLYPCYKKDKEAGRITDDEVLELLECYWLKWAQQTPVEARTERADAQNLKTAYSHHEHTTIGGQTIDGQDASNELSYLILQSKKEFPLDYPDLSVRIHSQTSQPFLLKVCDLLKEGCGYPKLMNDEEIIPLYLAWGATLSEARDYVGGGCVEMRILNRETQVFQPVSFSLGAALEFALNDGKSRLTGEQIGVKTGNPKDFKSYEEVWNAFRIQIENLMKYALMADYVGSLIRPQKLALPFTSSLQDICMEQGLDIQHDQGKFKNDINMGACGCAGFGTVIDSLAAIKKLVFEDKTVAMSELIDALDTNFKGKEPLRQMCVNAPKYGNADPYADSIGYEVEHAMISVLNRYTNPFGGWTGLRYLTVTNHVGLGKTTGATPNGRRAGEPLSDNLCPSQGADVKGPTAALISMSRIKNAHETRRVARLINTKLSPQVVAGEEGTENLASFIRAWCDMKHWHIQFNIINRETLIAAQKDPEKYRNLIVRVAGYSAYFVELSPEIQNDIISRTEHTSM